MIQKKVWILIIGIYLIMGAWSLDVIDHHLIKLLAQVRPPPNAVRITRSPF
jgi:hypothetical protein